MNPVRISVTFQYRCNSDLSFLFFLAVPQVEISLAEQRIVTLQHMAEEEVKATQLVQVRFDHRRRKLCYSFMFQRQYPLAKMVTLLRDYINHLKAVDQYPEGARKSNVESYYMPAEMVSANEWADFENVYQVHSPNLFMCNAVRDVSFVPVQWYETLSSS